MDVSRAGAARASLDRRTFLAASTAVLAATAARAEPDLSTAALYDAMLEGLLRRSPETATSYGFDTGPRAFLKRELDDRSPANRLGLYKPIVDLAPALERASTPTGSRDEIFRATALWLAQAVGPFAGFRYGAMSVDTYPVPYVVSQTEGAYQVLPDFLDTQHLIAERADAEAYLDRLTAFGPAMDQQTEKMRLDAAAGAAPPDFLLDRTISQLQSFQTAQHGAGASLVTSLVRRARDKGIAGDWELKAQQLVDGPIAAAAARQVALLQGLRPGARQAAGVGALPDGGAYYEACLKFHTTTSLTPDAVHQLGIEEASRVSDRARQILSAHGLGGVGVGEGMARLSKDPAQLFPDNDAGRAQVLAFVRAKLDDMQKRLPRAFSHLPRTPLEVRRVPPAIELGAPGAYEQSGAVDGSRPAAIYFNLHTTADWPRWTIATTAFHEGDPGHHLQGSLANENPDIPDLFKLMEFNAYVEGWALYAEQLADELGAYDGDPLGRLGMLQGSLFRACRLVVDTGLHSQGWSRDRAIAYLIDTAGSTPNDARREVERYCAWPGQACAYKIGQLQFLRLRETAKARLGARFDIRGFHDAVIGYGPMPLDVMARAVDAWVASV
ncbi:MAG TPA: DUF885 family protein [Caulobacteraceae bacterium]